jgi:hypothetical protein
MNYYSVAEKTFWETNKEISLETNKRLEAILGEPVKSTVDYTGKKNGFVIWEGRRVRRISEYFYNNMAYFKLEKSYVEVPRYVIRTGILVYPKFGSPIIPYIVWDRKGLDDAVEYFTHFETVWESNFKAKRKWWQIWKK